MYYSLWKKWTLGFVYIVFGFISIINCGEHKKSGVPCVGAIQDNSKSISDQILGKADKDKGAPLECALTLSALQSQGGGNAATTYTVTFDSQSPTVAANPTTKTVSLPATTIDALPTPPTKTGSIFSGWWTQVNGGGTEFTASTTVTSDLTVYAKWTAIVTYTVTFDSQSATINASPTTKTVDTPLATTVNALPNPPAKTMSSFGGWWTQTNGGGTQFTKNTPVTANITVYAKWSPLAAPSTFTNVLASPNQPINEDGTGYYGGIEYNGNIYFQVYTGSAFKLAKMSLNGVIDTTFGTSGLLSIPGTMLKGSMFYCGGKAFLAKATSGRYTIYKLNDSGSGSFGAAITNDVATASNDISTVSCINDKAYIGIYDNGATTSTTGTGIMLFDPATETFLVKIQNNGWYGRLYSIMQDSTGQIWAFHSNPPKISKVDASTLLLNTNGQKVMTDTLSVFNVGSFYYHSPTDFAWILAKSPAGESKAFVGSVDDFLTDASDGTLDNYKTLQTSPNTATAHNKIRIMSLNNSYFTWDSNNNPGTFLDVGFFDATGTFATNFNGGSTINYSYAPYNNSSNAITYMSLIRGSSSIYYIYQENPSGISVIKVTP